MKYNLKNRPKYKGFNDKKQIDDAEEWHREFENELQEKLEALEPSKHPMDIIIKIWIKEILGEP